jgi:hypothetical protein
MRIRGQPSPIQIIVYQKEQGSVEYFNHLGRMKTNDARCTHVILCRIFTAKAALSKNTLLNLRKKLKKCYIWSIAMYGAETLILRKVNQKYLQILICGAGEGWRRSVRPILCEMRKCYKESRMR